MRKKKSKLEQGIIVKGESIPFTDRRSFMKLSIEERRKILSDQAAAMVNYYTQDYDTKEYQGGDAIEY